MTETDTALWTILCGHLDRARHDGETRAQVLTRLLDPPAPRCVRCGGSAGSNYADAVERAQRD